MPHCPRWGCAQRRVCRGGDRVKIDYDFHSPRDGWKSAGACCSWRTFRKTDSSFSFPFYLQVRLGLGRTTTLHGHCGFLLVSANRHRVVGSEKTSNRNVKAYTLEGFNLALIRRIVKVGLWIAVHTFFGWGFYCQRTS